MRIVSANEIEFGKVSGHREGDIAFKRLISGTVGRPDNYELSLVRQRGHYATPRHRHNYDQFRYVLEGEYHYAGHRVMKTGTIGYFPEGTAYGPQEVKDCVVLAVQFGGLSGQGVLDYDSLKRGHQELAETGRFEKGVYYRRDADSLPAGTPKQKDGYEAVWEHVMQRDLVYAPARYDEPIVCTPDALPWVPDGETGVATKLCGAFAGDARMAFVKLSPRAHLSAGGKPATQLLYVLSGEGTLGGAPVADGSAAAIEPGETAELSAHSEMIVVHLGLPLIAA